MADKPLPWPRNAGTNRDEAAIIAASTLKILRYLLSPEGSRMNETEKIRMEARAALNCQDILRHLESQGAPTRPEPAKIQIQPEEQS